MGRAAVRVSASVAASGFRWRSSRSGFGAPAPPACRQSACTSSSRAPRKNRPCHPRPLRHHTKRRSLVFNTRGSGTRCTEAGFGGALTETSALSDERWLSVSEWREVRKGILVWMLQAASARRGLHRSLTTPRGSNHGNDRDSPARLVFARRSQSGSLLRECVFETLSGARPKRRCASGAGAQQEDREFGISRGVRQRRRGAAATTWPVELGYQTPLSAAQRARFSVRPQQNPSRLPAFLLPGSDRNASRRAVVPAHYLRCT